MKEIIITRKFVYNGITLPDPSSGLKPEAVREFYATQYPELNNAVVEGPVTKNNVSTYTFQRAAGAKGKGIQESPIRDRVVCIANGEANAQTAHLVNAELLQKMGPAYRALSQVTASRRVGRPLQLPSQAFGVWG